MANRKKLTEEEVKEIKTLLGSNEMLEKSKQEALKRGKDDAVKRIEAAQDDIKTQLNKYTKAQILSVTEEEKKEKFEDALIINRYDDDDDDILSVLNKTVETKTDIEAKDNTHDEVKETTTNEIEYSSIDSSVQYDVIPLPSNGECYKSKIGRLQVSYLTAYDENIITSPNLYRDGLVIDFLLKNKVLNQNFNTDDLCSGDVDAITLFLRATSYGAEFPISVKDPESGEKFDTVVDLSTFKIKDFNLKADENGYFDFTLPLSKDIVKFKYLTRKDEKNLRTLTQLENNASKAITILQARNIIANAMQNDSTLTKEEKTDINKTLDTVKTWCDKLQETKKTTFNKLITNRLEMSIMAVNDNTDRKFIHNYVKNMLAKDSLSLRKYILDNEPGVDWEVEIQRPENLGGGSFKTFLQWDDSIFYVFE